VGGRKGKNAGRDAGATEGGRIGRGKRRWQVKSGDVKSPYEGGELFGDEEFGEAEFVVEGG
jgi:hypothetical protein